VNVYVATSYSRASFVRAVVHEDLRVIGARPTSTWAENAVGPEDLATMTVAAIRTAYWSNYDAFHGSDMLLMLADEAQPREGFTELGWAFASSTPVVFVGRPTLSAAYHAADGRCIVVDTYANGLDEIRRLANRERSKTVPTLRTAP
jgi:hypothetical protein